MLKFGDVIVVKEDTDTSLRFVRIVTNAERPEFNEAVEIVFDVAPCGKQTYMVGTSSLTAFSEDQVIVLGNVNQAVVMPDTSITHVDADFLAEEEV